MDSNEKINKKDGSLYYMAPEILNKKCHSPITADLWALGVLIFRVFGQNYPYFC